MATHPSGGMSPYEVRRLNGLLLITQLLGFFDGMRVWPWARLSYVTGCQALNRCVEYLQV